MALSRLTNWADGDILTSAALEAEFDNIYNNALTLISPLTGNLAAGGNSITGLGLGSVGSPALQFTGDTNTGIYSSGADGVSLVAGGVAGLTATNSGGQTIINITSTGAGASGPFLQLVHDSASPADNDIAGAIDYYADDDTATARQIAFIQAQFEDVTSTTMDSRMIFAVMNNANAVAANTSAQLTSLGVWSDASGADGKEFFGDVLDVLGKMRALNVGVYRGRNIPVEKQERAERHFSCTAEDFYAVFGLGTNPDRGHPGIASKDVAFLGMRGVLELDDKVTALDRRVATLEARPIAGGR